MKLCLWRASRWSEESDLAELHSHFDQNSVFSPPKSCHPRASALGDKGHFFATSPCDHCKGLLSWMGQGLPNLRISYKVAGWGPGKQSAEEPVRVTIRKTRVQSQPLPHQLCSTRKHTASLGLNFHSRYFLPHRIIAKIKSCGLCRALISSASLIFICFPQREAAH